MRIWFLHIAAIAGVLLSPGIDAQSRSWEHQPLATLIAAAQKGEKQAQLELGKRYETGNGVPADTNRAMQLYVAAARTTSEKKFIYAPPERLGGAGRVVAVQDSRGNAGLPEAAQRLQALQQRQGWAGAKPAQPSAAPARMSAPAPAIKLVEPSSDAIASFFLPHVSEARIDVLAADTAKGVATGLFRASIHGKELYERIEARCKKREYRYVGDGRSVAEAMRYRDEQDFGKFVQWDVKYPYLQYLCNESVVRF